MPEEKPKSPPAEAGPARPGSGGDADPSMEDILASIRRILNEDEPAAGPPPAPAAAAPPPPDPRAAEPFDLTEDMLVSGPASPAAPEPPPAPPLTPIPRPAPPPAAFPAAPTPPAADPATGGPARDALLAPAVAAAASASVGQLLRTVAQERGSAVSRTGPTIEDVVREELRPLLKEWLDAHLPAVVERLVRAEIERVVGRALS